MLLVHFGFSVLLPHAFPGETLLLLHVRICLEKVEESPSGPRDHQKWSVRLDTTCTVCSYLLEEWTKYSV